MKHLAAIRVRATLAVVLVTALIAYLASREDCCSADPGLLLATAVMQPFNLVVFLIIALRFAFLARPARPAIWSCFKGSILATGMSILAPARGGDLLRITYLRQREGIPLDVGISISLIERVADLIVLLALTIVVVNQELLDSGLTPVITALAIIGIGLLALVSHVAMLTRIANWLLPAVIAGFVGSVLSETGARIRDGKFFLALGASAAFFGIGLVATSVFFGIATGREFPLSLSLTVLVFATVGAAIPILPGGLATFEAGVVLALVYGGFTAGESVVLAVAFRLQQFLVATPFALLIMTRERLGISAMMSEMYDLIRRRRAPAERPASTLDPNTQAESNQSTPAI